MTEGTWHKVASEQDVGADMPLRVDVAGEDIALFRIDGNFFATHNICTHAYASLVDGFLEGDEIECPLHEGRFNVRTGKALCPPVSEDLKTYPVKVEGGAIYVKV